MTAEQEKGIFKGLIETWDVLKFYTSNGGVAALRINRNMGCIEIGLYGL